MNSFRDPYKIHLNEKGITMGAQNIKINKHTLEEKKRIFTKALVRTAEYLSLTCLELSAILGPSGATFSRVFNRTTFIDPSSKEGQLALLLIRLYRSLNILFGGNIKQCELWLRSKNKHLGGMPIQLIQSIEGLVLAVRYLDVMRGKN